MCTHIYNIQKISLKYVSCKAQTVHYNQKHLLICEHVITEALLLRLTWSKYEHHAMYVLKALPKPLSQLLDGLWIIIFKFFHLKKGEEGNFTHCNLDNFTFSQNKIWLNQFSRNADQRQYWMTHQANKALLNHQHNKTKFYLE